MLLGILSMQKMDCFVALMTCLATCGIAASSFRSSRNELEVKGREGVVNSAQGRVVHNGDCFDVMDVGNQQGCTLELAVVCEIDDVEVEVVAGCGCAIAVPDSKVAGAGDVVSIMFNLALSTQTGRFSIPVDVKLSNGSECQLVHFRVSGNRVNGQGATVGNVGGVK